MFKLSTLFMWLIAILILAIAVIATIVSTGLTIFSFFRVTKTIESQLIVGGFFVMMQIMVLLGGLVMGFIAQYCPQHYKFMRMFTYMAFVLSVLSTTTYFNIIDKTERMAVIESILYLFPFITGTFKEWLVNNLTNITLIWLSCIILDLMAMRFPTVAIDLMRKNSVVSKVRTEPTLMGKAVYILTEPITTRIDSRYTQIQTKDKVIDKPKETIKPELPKEKEILLNNPSAGSDERDPKVLFFKNKEEKPYTEKEKDTYLNYISKNKNKDNSIPPNRKAVEAYKNRKTINLNNTKITAMREELYKNNVVIKPKKGAKTYFTNEYLNKLKNQNSVKISDKFSNLDKEKINNLAKS